MATPVQTRGDGGKEEKGSGHAVVIPSRVPPSRRSGGEDTETWALGAEGMVVVESVEVAVTVDDLESGRSTGAMKREKCPRHVIETTNSGTWGAESFEEGDQNANGRECAPSVPVSIQGCQETVGAMLADLEEYELILGTKCLRKDLNARDGVDAEGPTEGRTGGAEAEAYAEDEAEEEEEKEREAEEEEEKEEEDEEEGEEEEEEEDDDTATGGGGRSEGEPV
uniref:Uncharacterized protein n=1 Tax=Chromera velia CCMP2878 TaxID=1169474 RepID=A0A0G4GWF5_9ALVE|eukprot:Cvel_23669.t1-p1 / transcript=Cvel_23669.t1 / gene=Cvel_23669 / organism=Chromera_velia_CCMP2878 / gene_product=hypothetical protein / transcript_product=hypothetical protein / location=Cvel_scaffold2466:2154-11427(+) / protein_length=223 / sequence_SO=supercontig / SO=protein_coding / is_pseudo=false